MRVTTSKQLLQATSEVLVVASTGLYLATLFSFWKALLLNRITPNGRWPTPYYGAHRNWTCPAVCRDGEVHSLAVGSGARVALRSLNSSCWAPARMPLAVFKLV
jgi:hypothetical protein